MKLKILLVYALLGFGLFAAFSVFFLCTSEEQLQAYKPIDQREIPNQHADYLEHHRIK
jgi:hypothetical protein